MGRSLVTLDERASGVRLRRGGVDVTADLPHSLLYSVTAFETYFVYWSGATAAPLDLDIAVRDAPTPKVKDLMTGALQNPTRVERHGDRVVLGLPAADHPLVVDFNFGNAFELFNNFENRVPLPLPPPPTPTNRLTPPPDLAVFPIFCNTGLAEGRE